MNLNLLRGKDADPGYPIFRTVTQFLYTTLLLHLALAYYRSREALSSTSLLALAAVAVLFLVAMVRMLWPQRLRATPP